MTDELKAETERLLAHHPLALAQEDAVGIYSHITALQAEIDRLREFERTFNYVADRYPQFSYIHEKKGWSNKKIDVTCELFIYDTLFDAVKAAMGGEGE